MSIIISVPLRVAERTVAFFRVEHIVYSSHFFFAVLFSLFLFLFYYFHFVHRHVLLDDLRPTALFSCVLASSRYALRRIA